MNTEILVGKQERKRKLGRRQSKWKDTIKLDLMEINDEG
jgi:hypothetical protein